MVEKDIKEHIYFLSEEIGARGPTTDNEEKGAQYISSIFKKNGLEVNNDIFLSPNTFSFYYAVPCFIIFLSMIIFIFNNLLAILISFIGCFFFICEINTIETISKLFPKKNSQNVLAKIKPIKSVKRKLVIIAHHDTSKSCLSFNPKFIKYFRASIILMIFSVIFVPLSYSFIYLFSLDNIFFYITIPFSIYLLASILNLIHREFFYDYVKGANDNASGVGVLLKLSETFSHNKLENTELWFLSTGCEEVGGIGMVRFLKKYEKDLKDAFFLNIDNIGGGQLRYSSGEGLIKAFKCSNQLIEIAKESALNINIPVTEFVSKIYPTNAVPCLVRKYKAISILATNEKGLIPNWHWETDIIENLDEKTLNDAYQLLLEMILKFDLKINGDKIGNN